MQDNFKKQDGNIEDILDQVRRKKQEEFSQGSGLSQDSSASKSHYKPVFSPQYKEDTDITFTTPPVVKLETVQRPKPQGPVFGAKPPVKEIPIPPPANNKGHGVVTGLLNSLDRPGKPANAPAKPQVEPEPIQVNMVQPQPVPPAAPTRPQTPKVQQVKETTPNVPEQSVTPKEPPQEKVVVTPVVSETFTPPTTTPRTQQPKAKRSTTTYIPKEKVITKEVVKPTVANLLELEKQMDAMDLEGDSSSAEVGSTGTVTSSATSSNFRTGSIRVEDFDNERFYQFFSSTVAVDKDMLKSPAKKRRDRERNYFNTTSINTGDFPKSESFVKAQETDESFVEEPVQDVDIDDYHDLKDAAGILADLKKMSRIAIFRFVATLLLTGIVSYLCAALIYVMPLPAILEGENADISSYIAIISLMVATVVISFPTFGRGFTGLFTIPTQDSFVFLSMLGAISQIAVLAITSSSAIAQDVTLFAPFAMLAYTVNALGRWLQMRGITDNFSIASEGYDHSAAYLVNNREAVLKLTAGIKEEYPELMLSRPTALVKNYLRQSFSPHSSDKNGKRFGLILLFVSIAAAIITYFLSDANLIRTVSVFTAVIVISAPLAAIFVQVLPTVFMNKSASRVGAIIPGWEAIEGIGRTTAVMLNSHDIFPPTTVRLHAIKTFNKEQRVDLAILYAASVLTKACDTLRDIFLSMIEGKTEMLFEIESLTKEVGYGFTAWVDGKRINIGNREMMEKHNIPLPSMDFESRYSRSERSVIYLAVSGNLYCMFLVSYVADEDIALTLNILRQSEVSLLIRSDDFNITSELVSQKFEISIENVKVLNGKEEEIAQRYTNYLPESEGLMTHFGSFSSFIGGLRAASAAESAEHMAAMLEAITVILSLIMTVVLAVTSGLHNLHGAIILAYQAVWLVITILVIMIKRY